MAQNQSAKPTQQNTNSGKTSVIAHGTVINGNFKANDNLRIDGTIIGDLQCDKRLVIGSTGYIKGKIIAAEISVEGKIEGEATSRGIATLGPKSNYTGILNAVRLEIAEGAIFNGDFKISRKV